MENIEFNAHILARIIQEAGIAVIIGGEDSDEIVKDMVGERCCEALKDIRDILDDDILTDKECYDRIERIVRLCEELGPGAGSRHDFG